MSQTIDYGSTFNPLTTFVNDIYNEVIPPQSFFGGIPTSIAFARGTAAWGDIDSPVLCSDSRTLFGNFGNLAPAAVTDQHDLVSDVLLALSQAPSGNQLAVYCSRAQDGTAVKATYTVKDTSNTPASMGVVTSRKYGQEGNNVRLNIAPGQAGLATSIAFNGTLTVGDVLNLTFYNQLLPSGKYNLAYTLVSGDTTATLLATHVAAAINADVNLLQPRITAVGQGPVVQLSWPSSIGSVNIQQNTNGTNTATIGGTMTVGDTVSIVVNDASLANGTKTISYTTIANDTSTLIATALKNAINADTSLIALGVTATSTAAVLSLKSASKTFTTYVSALSTNATETVTITGGPTETATLTPTNTLTVQVIPFSGGGQVELYTGLPNTGAGFAAAFAQALLNGQSSARPPSAFITLVNPTATANPPLLGTYVLSGGTDGRNVNTSQLLGNQTNGGSGIYQAASLQFQPSVLWICGLDDPQAWPAMQAFARQKNIFTVFAIPAGTSTDAAVALKNQYGMQDFQIGFFKDWHYIFDSYNNQHRLVPPTGIMGGAIAALAPWESPFNKTVKSLLGTERTNPYTGNTPYLNDEIASLTQAGIMFLTNDGPGGNTWRFRNGCNSVGNNDVVSPVEYGRMINFIIGSQDSILKPYLGKLQSQKPTDSVRAQIATALNSFYQPMADAEYIDDYEVICDLRNNSTGPTGTIARHLAITSQKVRFMSSILDIFNNIQGGTNVVLNGTPLTSVGVTTANV